ncbi:MAG: hypothetical protein C7B47_15520 [Sulfobacillus thermosulfidooxidans]|uniref:Lauroyl/myristoyl acyltransferase n=1 Tax=Sulfobacillus thermosulfidooxidans TaxID=28034 RepID=A0A2T2WP46_SULTH|nr:MAG: hypothetical protein C7B47_15520 [Sulfobacillus thermosulfidooxidans]
MRLNAEQFMTLYNMRQELAPRGWNPLSPLSDFQQYFAQLGSMQHDWHIPKRRWTTSPSPWLLDRLQDTHGAIIVSIHFSLYFRFLPIYVGHVLKTLHRDKRLGIVMERDSLALESPAWHERAASLNLFPVDAQSRHVGLGIFRALLNGDIIFTYLDADAGLGENPDSLSVDFLEHGAKLRSGLFRLAVKSHSPILPLVSSPSGDLLWGPIIGADTVQAIGLQAAAQHCMTFFEQCIVQWPYAWFHWASHHYRTSRDETSCTVLPGFSPETEWVVCDDCVPSLRLHLPSGAVYIVESEEA